MATTKAPTTVSPLRNTAGSSRLDGPNGGSVLMNSSSANQGVSRLEVDHQLAGAEHEILNASLPASATAAAHNTTSLPCAPLTSLVYPIVQPLGPSGFLPSAANAAANSAATRAALFGPSALRPSLPLDQHWMPPLATAEPSPSLLPLYLGGASPIVQSSTSLLLQLERQRLERQQQQAADSILLDHLLRTRQEQVQQQRAPEPQQTPQPQLEKQRELEERVAQLEELLAAQKKSNEEAQCAVQGKSADNECKQTDSRLAVSDEQISGTPVSEEIKNSPKPQPIVQAPAPKPREMSAAERDEYVNALLKEDEEFDQQNAESQALKKRRKKDKALPKRPLSAYNLFFRDERARMAGGDEFQHELDRHGKKIPSADARVKRPAKVGFENLARTIAKKWKSIDKDTKAHYQKLAEGESARYSREREALKAKEDEGEADVAAKEAMNEDTKVEK